MGPAIRRSAWRRGFRRAVAIGVLELLAIGGANAGGAPPDLVGEPAIVMTRAEDTVQDIARRYDVGAAALEAANPGLDPDEYEFNIVRVPTRHILPSTRHDIVINLAELRLYAWRDPGRPPITMPIGKGRECPAMVTGTSELERDGSQWRLPGTGMRIAIAQESATVGTQNGRGCLELYPEDFARLALHMRPGQPVTLIDEPAKAARGEEGLLLEVHADESGRRRASEYEVAVLVLATCADESWRIDWQAVREVTLEGSGVPTNVLRAAPD